jgi:CHAD domain-containing protein
MDRTLKKVKRFYIDQTDRYFKSLSKIEKRLPNGIHKGSLHQMRLTIKNMKAVHQFFKIVEIENKTIRKLERQINRMNKPLGKIREHQVNRDLAKINLLNYPIKKTYLGYLEEQTVNDFVQLRKKLHTATFHFNRNQRSHINKELARQEESVISPKLKAFLLEKIDAIHQLLHNLSDEQQIHRIRKNLKLIKSVLTAVKMEGIADMTSLGKDLNKTEKQIGHWHDSIVFRDSLLQFCSKYPEFEQAVTINLELIEADNLMFQDQLPNMIHPLILELRKELEKK